MPHILTECQGFTTGFAHSWAGVPGRSWWSASADLAETSAMRLHEKIRMRTPSSRIFSRFGHQSKLGSSDTR